jgi:4-amino-4-deoxy-L-arabinose transferase-like glycosyltransferase
VNLYLNHRRLFFLLVGLFGIFVVLNSTLLHQENDEVVYQTLTQKISCSAHRCLLPDLSNYSLQNTSILDILDKSVYDKPIFFRPPAYIYINAIFFPILGKFIFYIIPPFLYIGIIILIYESLYLVTKSDRIALQGFVLAIFSPFLIFHVFKIWMDLFMTFLVYTSFYCVILYQYQKQALWFILLGSLSLTLAVLTKYQAIIFLPLMLFIATRNQEKYRTIIIFFINILSLCFVGIWIWYISRFNPTIQFILSNNPSNEVIQQFPFVKYVAQRPFYYYFSSLILLNPVYLICFIPQVLLNIFTKNINIKNKLILLSLIVYVFSVLVVFSIIAKFGSTFQSRYVLMIQPFLVFLMSFVPIQKNILVKTITILFILIALFTVSINISMQNAEIFSLDELVKMIHYGHI